MSENQNYADILAKRYIGFFTESAKEDLEDVIKLIKLIHAILGDKNGGTTTVIINEEIVSLFNIIYRELQSIKSGIHLSGGIFSWREAEAVGLIKASE
ncbi:hypothetical protein RCU96_22600 [Escherichia coli]|uniref:hypothetical protein n=1 Tax=Escherichia coli TaxID=562 RepID=UPI001CC12689|nr:hypothetical protein [Escherichia coli]MED0462919.1 hypothetical protein [Escherichia coli]HBB8935541.1 hypothetical protein [Escherichia coli]HDK0048428.1 hypothetical protein [Escherichia coli]